MKKLLWLFIPIAIGISALQTGHLIFKLGVPFSCSVILVFVKLFQGDLSIWRRAHFEAGPFQEGCQVIGDGGFVIHEEYVGFGGHTIIFLLSTLVYHSKDIL